jgi:predicted peroxiredoxin
MEELLESCAALGVRFLVCEAGLLAVDLAADTLRDDLPIEITGAVSFLAAIPSGSVTFFV